MPRYFAPITEPELQSKINALGSFRDMVDKLQSDLKVTFDLENTNCSGSGLLGYNTLPNGLTYLGCSAGGDWENPVFFIVYWDGKKVRAYVPMEGNPWNTTTKEAYGNDEDADLANARKRWPEDFKDVDYADNFSAYESDDEIVKDITARILPVPSGLKPKAQPKSTKKKTLQERIEALVYYAPGDEGEELFQATCALCYKMYGLGNEDKAEELYKWAKEMADDSKEWAEAEGRDDTVNGYWGN